MKGGIAMEEQTVYEQPVIPVKKKGKKGILILLCLLLCGAIGFSVFWYLTADDRLYAQGVAYMDTGEYALAIEVFAQLPDYPGTPELLQKSYYHWGDDARLDKDYETAREHYLAAGDYKDAFTQSQRMAYALGHEAFIAGDYDKADEWFALLDDITKFGDLHFRTMADAAPYLKQQQENFAEKVMFCLGEIEGEDFYSSLRNYLIYQYAYPMYYRDNRAVVIDSIVYYPGDRIYYAWKNGDTASLSEQEQQTLALALEVVEQAKAQTETDLELQLWLHDWICKQVVYESPNMDVKRKEYLQLTELSCIGVMLEGKANCQGYTDAFALLGRLAGFEVSRLFGIAGEGHTWNIIKLDDLWYIVDVTFDDMSEESSDGWCYTFFNTGWDPEAYSIFGGEVAAPALAEEPHPTKNYFAYTQNSFDSIYDAAYDIVSQKLWEGKKWTYVKITDATVSGEQFNDMVYRIAQNRIYGGASWGTLVYPYNGDSYVVTIWQ
jgi:hypothetical protein